MALLALCLCFAGCGKRKPSTQATQPVPTKPTPKAPKAEPTKATSTPGMEAAKKAHDEGRYQDAVRLYTAELATEEAKPAPSWVELRG